VSLLVGPWSVYQSIRHGESLLVSHGSAFRFDVGNNPNATGASFPYPEIQEPAGLEFIAKHPARWLWLVKERFLYLWGFREGINEVFLAKGKLAALNDSFIRPVLSWLDRVIGAAYLLLFVAGAVAAGRQAHRGTLPRDSIWLLYGLLLAVIVPPLITISSARFTIPMLPIVFLFQAYATVEIARFLRHRTARCDA
jgi:hypothetical protein